MAISDWEFVGSGSEQLQTISPVSGTSHLEITVSGGFNIQRSAQVTAASGITRGIARGKIRTLIRYDNGATSTPNYAAGIYCLATNSGGFAASGTAYSLTVNANTGDLRLHDDNISASGFSQMNVLASASISFTAGTTMAIELEWDSLRQVDIGGTHFIARSGTQTDYSDLTERFQHIEPNGAVLTSGFEGLVVFHDASSTPNNTIWAFDDTEIFTVA